MQKIFDLSEHEETFLGRKYEKEDESEKEEEFSFSLDQPRINLIRRLLELDEQLAVMHARLSGKAVLLGSVIDRQMCTSLLLSLFSHLNSP
jgi:hypothetical protein